MRVLVTGSNGLLGTKLVEQLLARGHEAVGSGRGDRVNGYLGDFRYERLDVANAAQVRRVMTSVRPDLVLHAGAVTDVDGCERPDARERAWETNAVGSGLVAEACAEQGAHLVYVSTEYVFDGRAGPYDEESETNPLGWYAQTKREGEIRVVAASQGFAIARTTVVYGHTRHARKDFVAWLLGSLRAGTPVRIVADQIGSPTLADNLAGMVLAIGLVGASGVFNTAGAEIVSRHEFALKAARRFGLDESLIGRVTTAELGLAAPRPLHAGLLMHKFRQRFPDEPVLSIAQALDVLAGQMGATAASSGDTAPGIAS
ncbi:MAG: SDR family oxidoreductase [Chloroflexota bacterium]